MLVETRQASAQAQTYVFSTSDFLQKGLGLWCLRLYFEFDDFVV